MTSVCTANPASTFTGYLAGLVSERRGRVLLLVATVIALSVVDLYLTLVYATTIGLPELNPLARTLLAHGSVLDVVLWKSGTLSICVGILLRLRENRAAEIGAWISLIALIALTWQWHAFSEIHTMIAEAGPAMDYGHATGDETLWVTVNGQTRIP